MELEIKAKLQQMYEAELKEHPPLPPWLFIPGADRYDIAWRMGAGEDQIMKLAAYFMFCGPEALARYRAAYPEPKGWEGWYDE